MIWHFCIDSTEKRALDLCDGSMHVGEGLGNGYGYGWGYAGNGRLGGDGCGSGDRPGVWSDGYAAAVGDGWGNGLYSHYGDGYNSTDEW